MKKIAFKILRRTGLLKRFKFNLNVKINNRRFIIPIINEVGLKHYLELSEQWMLHILDKLISHSDYQKMFIDVGVNIGQTLIKVKSVAPSIHYIGFEPNPSCVNYLYSLIATNKLINTDIIPVGIGDKSSILKLQFYTNSEVDGSASVIEGFRSRSRVKKTINVPVFNFSDILIDKESKIGIIKIDVEGAEFEVMKGFKDKIQSDRPIIFVEILPASLDGNPSRILSQHNIQKLILELNYKILRVIKDKDRFIKVQEISEFGFHADMNLCEYILTPAELNENIKITFAN